MKQTDYAGLSHFQKYCKEFDEQYVVVGGCATIMLLDEELGEGHGKATFDIDLVLLTNNSVELAQRIKQYITDGKYDIQVGEKEQYKYYRFNNPKEENFAKNDDRVICPGCGKKIVPRLVVYQGSPQKSLCPYCACVIKSFTRCFIATAVYGDCNHPKVITLRKFRD